jgi:phospholipid/cholesterol/gamma-HCH transport system permease protein
MVNEPMNATLEPGLSLDIGEGGSGASISATGAWTAAAASGIDARISELIPKLGGMRDVAVDLGQLEAFDTYGAWLLERLIRDAGKRDVHVTVINMPDRFRGLASAVHDARSKADREALQTRSDTAWLTPFETIGRALAGLGNDIVALFSLFGAVVQSVVDIATGKTVFRATSTVHQFDRVAWQAIPIVFLITFLIGGIVAQQGFFHFRKFGADQYVVDMVGILMLREIGVLLVAIMIAGRSGSSYTAELGAMKMREEIDALRTMGLDPVAVLILPRLLALVLALPALAFLGAMSALLGGGLVAWFYGDMSPYVFIERLKDAISITHFKVGIIKAPFMALVIGLVACVEGLRVEGSAESLGLHTTASVVKAIFLVIVLDGLFAIFFASIGM